MRQFALPLPEPPAPEPEGPTPGEVRGDLAALEAAARGVEVYLGPTLGWRRMGACRNRGPMVLVQQHGRLAGGFSFDLGPAAPLPPDDDE